MKRKILLLLCAAVLMLSVVGCGSIEKTKNVDLSNITSAIEAYDKGSYATQSIGDLKTTYDIDSGDVKQFVAKTKTESFGYVMIEATSGDAANRIEEKLNNYIGMFSRVGFDKVVKHGNYVGMFSSSEQGKAESMANAFSGFLAAE